MWGCHLNLKRSSGDARPAQPAAGTAHRELSSLLKSTEVPKSTQSLISIYSKVYRDDKNKHASNKY